MKLNAWEKTLLKWAKGPIQSLIDDFRFSTKDREFFVRIGIPKQLIGQVEMKIAQGLTDILNDITK